MGSKLLLLNLEILISILILCVISGTTPLGTPIPLAQNIKDDILKTLNGVRSSVLNPTASNMNRLRWNSTLAEGASETALTCLLEVSSTPQFSDIGQTITISSNTRISFVGIIEASWLASGSLYNSESNTCSSIRACSNYTQVIRAVSTEVGCAIARCASVPTFPVPNAMIYHCHFSPKGSTSERPYVPGTPCSACPNNTVCRNNLCGDIETPSTAVTTSDSLNTITSSSTEVITTSNRTEVVSEGIRNQIYTLFLLSDLVIWQFLL